MVDVKNVKRAGQWPGGTSGASAASQLPTQGWCTSERPAGHRRSRRDRGAARRVHRRGDDARLRPGGCAVHQRRRAADAQRAHGGGRPGRDPRLWPAGAGHVGLLRADHPPGHDPAGRRHRRRPGLPVRADPAAQRPLGAELRHLPRPLPAHPGRLEVHRARLRDQVPGTNLRWRARRRTRLGKAASPDRAGRQFKSLFRALCASLISTRIVHSTGLAWLLPRWPRAASLYCR